MIENPTENGELGKLNFLLGRAGTGKSKYIIDKICDIIKEDYDGKKAEISADTFEHVSTKTKIYLIVPEQFSFETERAILQQLGARMGSAVKVWSFSRMAEGVFRETGGFAGRRIDDQTRVLLVSKALAQSADWLKIYNKSALYPETVNAVTRMVTELKTCGISDRKLESISSGLTSGILKNKTEDIGLILSTYNALLSAVADGSKGRYIDPLDELNLLCEKIPRTDLFDNSYVFIDSFKGFTGQEFKIIEQLLKKCSSMTVSLCCASLYDEFGGFGLFAPVIQTADTLRNIARMNGISVCAPIILTENHRANNETLRFLEGNIFNSGTENQLTFAEKTEHLSVINCDDIYQECDFVARDIRRRIREQNGSRQSLRFRDFAVVSRDIESYRGIIDAALEKQEVNYNLDNRVDIRTQPLITLVLASLDAVNNGFYSDDIFRVLKTGLVGFSNSSVSLIENYAFMWQINYSRWSREWTGNPDGMTGKTDQKSTSKLWYINLLRGRLMKDLIGLRHELNPSKSEDHDRLIDGETFAKSIYDYLIRIKSDKLLKFRVENFEKVGQTALAGRMSAVWETCMSMLDRFATVFRRFKSSSLYFTKLFKVMAESVDIGEIPHFLDGVHLGSADRIRFSSPKIVYIIGANEGVFPAHPSNGGLFSDKERRELISCDLPLSAGFEKKALEERFIGYQAISAPSETLIISYVKSDGDGNEARPSVLVESSTALIPYYREIEFDLEITESKKDFIEQTALLFIKPSETAQSYRDLLSELERVEQDLGDEGVLSQFKSKLTRIEKGINWRFDESYNAARLFGKDTTLSPSMIELYHQCKFAYFCRYGLRAKPLQIAELDNLAFGTLAHYVMENLLPRYIKFGVVSVKKETVIADTNELIHQYIKENLGGIENKSAKFVMLCEKLIKVVESLVWHVVCELSQSEFVPVDYELAIGIGEEKKPVKPPVQPLILTLASGDSVKVIGKVDRIDVFEKGGISYVRVVDYKTGNRAFKLSDVTQGLNMQMLIYLSTLWQNGKDRYGEVVPAGMLYLPAILPVIDSSDFEDKQNHELEQIKAMKMNGLLIDNPEIIAAMQTDDTNGVFIPAKMKKNGELYSASSVASLEQFGKLKIKAENLIKNMATNLLEGEIPAIPTAGSIEACEWCDFKTVCGRNDDDPVRFITSKSLNESLNDIDANVCEKNDGGESLEL